MNTLTSTRGRATSAVKRLDKTGTAVGHAITYTLMLVMVFAFTYLTPSLEIIESIEGAPTGCVPSMSNNWCAPQDDPQVNATVADLERQGLVCSDEAALTDTIVFQYSDDHSVAVLTFDEAAAAGKDGLGWTQKFCS